MSTANLPTESTRYVEFDDYVEFQLAKTRKSIKANDLMTAIAAVAALLLGGALLFVVLDHWLIPGGFSVAVRWVWFLSLFGLVAGGLIWSIGVPALRSVNRLFAAKELEHADPALRSNLLNWVDLRDAGRTVDPGVLKTIEKQAATQLSKMDVGQAVDHRRLLQTAYALLAIVVLFCGYALISPKKISTALWRMLPFTNAGAVTRTEILGVEPGDATLLVRGRLEVTATLAGELPETVQFLYSTADGRIKDEAVQLRPESEGLARYRGVFSGETGQGVLQDFTYYIAAGDAQSARYRVLVRQPPSATVQEVSYTFPEYMRLDETLSSGGHIDGWEGATATIHATSDKTCKSAMLQFLSDPQSPPTGEELPVEVADGTHLRAVWTLSFRNDGTFPKHYRIQCRGEEGEVDPTPVVYSINVKPDRPPEVVLLHPERDLTAPANGVIPLLVQASDPDFELGYINLHAEQVGQSIHRQQLSEGRQQAVMLEHDFKLADLNLKPGEEFEFWVEAFDNRQPRRNRKNTPRIKVTIAEPATPEEAQQQLAEQKKEREERLEEANHEQNGEPSESEPMPQDGDAERGEDDADPKEREPQPQENGANEDRNSQTEDTGEKPDGEQTGDAQQKTGEGGKSSAKDGAQESPLSPEGENDDEVLERLNDLLKPKKDQPQDSAKPDRSPKSNDRNQKQPRNDDEKTPHDDGMPPDAGDEQGDDEKVTGEKAAGEKSDANNATKSKSRNPSSDQTNKDADESESDPEPMPSDDTESDGGSEAEPRSKPEGESNSKTKSGRDDKSPDSKADDEPMPGETDSNTSDDEATESETETEKGDRPDQSTKPAAKNDARGKPEQKPKTKPGDDAESKDSEEPTDDGDMPDESAANSDDKQSPQKTTKSSKDSQKTKPGSKSSPKTGDETSDTQSPDGDMPEGDETGDEPQRDDKTESGDSKSGGKKSGSKPKSPSRQQPSGKSEPNSKGDTETGDEPSDDMSDTGDEPTPSEDENAEPKSQQKSAAKSKNAKRSGDKKHSPADRNDAEATKTEPGEEPSEDGAQPEENADPKGDAERKTQTKAPKQKPADESEETGKGEEPSPDAEQNSEGDPDGADEELKGPGNSKGQKSDKPDSGEGGGSKQDKQGNPGGKTPGPGENADQPGDDRAAKEGSGKPNPGDRRGEGSTKQDSDKPGEGEGDGENGEQNEKHGEKSQGGGKDSAGGGKSDAEGSESGDSQSKSDKPGAGKAGKSSGKPGKSGKPGDAKPGKAGESSNPTDGGASGNGFAGQGGDADAVETDPEAANLDYNRRAAELVLQRLKDDLNNDSVDPKLLEDLGWTPEQLQRFTERLAKQLEKPADELSPLDEARRQQFEEMLKSLNLKSGGTQRSGENVPQREIDQTGARRAPVPQDYKAAYEAFTKNLSKRKDAKPKR